MFITFLVFKHTKVESLVTSSVLCQLPITEASQSMTPSHVPQFRCHYLWITTFITAIMAIGVIIDFYKVVMTDHLLKDPMC